MSGLTRTVSHPPQTDFDVVAHYNNLIKSDPALPVPIAAIESLIDLLNHTPLTTVSETLALVDAQTLILRKSASNPIPISAGTDLFQRYLVASFQQRFGGGSGDGGVSDATSTSESDFSTLRAKLVATSKLFISKGKTAAGQQVAANFLPLVVNDGLVFTYPSTRLIETVIQHATDKGQRYFTLVNLVNTPPSTTTTTPSPSSSSSSSSETKSEFSGIPTSTLPLHAFQAAVSSSSNIQRQSSVLILSCHAVFSNGALLTPLGSHTLALAAREAGIPVYCTVESFNFVRSYPLSSDTTELTRLGVKKEATAKAVLLTQGKVEEKDVVEIVPAALITGLVTENGIMAPSSVSEELIKLWF